MSRPFTKPRFAALFVMATVVSGCGASSAVPSSSIVAASDDATRDCEDQPLRDPAGQPVFLGGRWIGSGDPNALPAPSVFLIRQTNSCLTWVGLSATDGEAVGASWIEAFTGRIRSDFTIVGAWEEVPDGGRGTLTAAIEFVPDGDRYEAEITLADSSGDVHRTKNWVREDVEP